MKGFFPLPFKLALVVLMLFAAAEQCAHAGGKYDAYPWLPDPVLTPGAIATTDAKKVCRPGYAKSMRHTSGSLKAKVYKAYHVTQGHTSYEVDHLVPLELGGADVQANLWPQPYRTEPWNAHVKDRLEDWLHTEVCNHRMPLPEAQQALEGNWIAAYKQYLGEP